ncbi:hypothetical protein GCM10010399_31570 [Dactylosporangium fulvum]|uniref:Right-handed parallel beta-helix repeat-containing protein n=1 Tax=Dactylosporangium fulvum TaxID=53359 RepID=A0ABY5W5M4_9ACTN|nr:right-handed parallel beta-helix repeat-containing protein [Dactylosporangium fulvum]UWP83998.1 right-handed parallel beta-helix repeat-containing protein [Dactylosporangium fulvum]
MSTDQVRGSRAGRHTPPSSPRSRRPWIIGGAIVGALAVAGAATVVILQLVDGDSDAGPDGGTTEKATVISTDGATVDGQKLTSALHIKANNVKVTNTTVHHTGTVAIKVFAGFTGTVIDNTEVFCDGKDMTGVGYGNYTASRVKVHGCTTGFSHSAAAPVIVSDSSVDDKPYKAKYAFEEPGKKHATSGAGLTPGPVKASKPWPGPENTGVPAGTKLTPYTGKYVITEPNTVIDGKILTDCLDIKAKNVTIKRSKITCKNKGGMIIRVFDDLVPDASLTVEDSEIQGEGEGLGVGFGHYTLRRVNMHTLNEGPRVSDGAVIEDCWIHGLVFTDEKDHQDILQTTGGTGMVVRHNTLEAFNPTTNDPFNAGFQLGSETAPSLSNLLVEDNLFTGGNYTVNIRPDTKADNVIFRGNVFVRNSRYGPASNEDLPGVKWEPSNVYLDTSKPVTHD